MEELNNNITFAQQQTNDFRPPVFYLKINRTTEYALSCFWHWVEIVDTYGADFYVVCDNDEAKRKILEKRECKIFTARRR